MGHRFAEIAFTPSVRELQRQHGSSAGYAAIMEGQDSRQRLGEAEATFIAARDSFYVASVSETGWPYVQHRGGPAGFVKVIDEAKLGFADYSGNRQYITTGNVAKDNRVALFFMDYPNRTRLKLLGRIEVVGHDEAETIAQLEDGDYRARIERGMVIHVEAFDWNCPQHITPRFSAAEVEELMQPLRQEIAELTAERRDRVQPATEVLGTGELELTISGIRQLTPRIHAYELRAESGAQLPPVQAGAHLAVPVMLPDGREVIRHYSVSSNPARRDIYEIAVLQDPQGHGGSQAVHYYYRLGMKLRIAAPRNHFALHSDNRPAVLIAGGIGITPIKAMAQALDKRGADFALHYAGRSRSEMAYAGRLELALGERLQLYPGDEGKRLSVKNVLTSAPDDAVFYVCGPTRLLDAVLAEVKRLGIDDTRLRYERFSPAHQAEDRPVRVELAHSGGSIEVAADETILDALLRNGISASHSCMTGECRSCATEVLEGTADHRDSALSDHERDALGLMCPCVSRATSETLTLNI